MNSFRLNIPKQIVAITALAVTLNIIRIFWTDSLYFIGLIWNIFLAFLPFALSSFLLWSRSNRKMAPAFFVFGGIVWLFLFPNAPYLVTDMIHLNADSIIPIWYDVLLLFCTAWVGILLGVYSLSHIEDLFLTKYSKKFSAFLLGIVILLSSFGIYIGRFLRWNSWDVVVQPLSIWADVWEIFSHPILHREAYIFTFFFFIFILVSYRAWKYSRVSS